MPDNIYITVKCDGKTISHINTAKNFSNAVAQMKKDVIAEAKTAGLQVAEKDLCAAYKDIGVKMGEAWLHINETNILWQVLRI